MIFIKHLFYISLIVLLCGCDQSKVPANHSISTESLSTDSIYRVKLNPDYNEFISQSFYNQFTDAKLFRLNDTIRADFNGDGAIDKALFIDKNDFSGIIIIHGNTNDTIQIGFGKDFSVWDKFDCNWVDYWGLVEDNETEEIIFDDNDDMDVRNVILEHPAIFIGESEVGGGLIYYRNGKYEWIHQTC